MACSVLVWHEIRLPGLKRYKIRDDEKIIPAGTTYVLCMHSVVMYGLDIEKENEEVKLTSDVHKRPLY